MGTRQVEGTNIGINPSHLTNPRPPPSPKAFICIWDFPFQKGGGGPCICKLSGPCICKLSGPCICKLSGPCICKLSGPCICKLSGPSATLFLVPASRFVTQLV
uniref:Uncharacterized protein n=1 Tax=Paramormyrops kingsleyae TaxID=1676925 RepID=A0A3B3S3K4_9TELE